MTYCVLFVFGSLPLQHVQSLLVIPCRLSHILIKRNICLISFWHAVPSLRITNCNLVNLALVLFTTFIFFKVSKITKFLADFSSTWISFLIYVIISFGSVPSTSQFWYIFLPLVVAAFAWPQTKNGLAVSLSSKVSHLPFLIFLFLKVLAII